MRCQHEPNINTGAHFDTLYSGQRRGEMLPYAPLEILFPAFGEQGRVIDVGCGWGQYRPYFPDCFRYLGIDFAPQAIREAKKEHPDSLWVCADFSKQIPCRREWANLVLCLETLEHMEDPERLIGEIRRVLVPRGLAVLSVPYRDSIVTPEHLWEFEESDWPELLKDFSSHAVFRYCNEPTQRWEHFLVLARK